MKISAIYKIQSKIKPERLYIGSAMNLSKRWDTHLRQLEKQTHHSKKLQRHYEKYGKLDLEFSILLECDIGDLIKIEQYFLDSYNPYFNSCKIAGSSLGFKHSQGMRDKMKLRRGEKRPPMPEERKRKISSTRKKRKILPWNYHKIGVYSKEAIEVIASKHRKPLCQYDLNGNYIKDWDSARTAGNVLKISAGNITQVAKEKKKSANGYLFKYKI